MPLLVSPARPGWSNIGASPDANGLGALHGACDRDHRPDAFVARDACHELAVVASGSVSRMDIRKSRTCSDIGDSHDHAWRGCGMSFASDFLWLEHQSGLCRYVR